MRIKIRQEIEDLNSIVSVLFFVVTVAQRCLIYLSIGIMVFALFVLKSNGFDGAFLAKSAVLSMLSLGLSLLIVAFKYYIMGQDTSV